MLSEKVSNEVLIDIERFSNALKWFGPIRFDSMNTIAQRIEAVMSQPWFFGDIETVESQRKVEEAGVPGGYLVRLNLGGGAKVEEAPYTITTAAGKSSFHTRCYRRQEKAGFIVQIKKGEEKLKIITKSNLIEDLIRELTQKDSAVCGTPIGGHPYRGIFEGARSVSSYNVAPDDD